MVFPRLAARARARRPVPNCNIAPLVDIRVLTILLYITDQIGKIYQSFRTHPSSTSWLLGFYIGTYIISCSLLLSGLRVTIRFDGVFVVIYLASAMANIISLLWISNWAFTWPERSDVLRYIEEVKALTKS